MRINNIKIKGYKNLKDFSCNLPDSNVIAFIGNNGSGKSNLLECILEIFIIMKNLDQFNNISYLFDFIYEIGSNYYRIENNNYSVKFYANRKLDIKKLETSLPKVIFTYYAGETDRLTKLSKIVDDKAYNVALKQNKEIDLKYITPLSLKDFSLAFLVHYIFDTQMFKTIKKRLNFDSVNHHHFLIKIKKPNWASKNGKVDNLWGARGFIKLFYDEMLKEDEEYDCGAFEVLDSIEDGITLHIGHIDLIKKLAVTPLEFYTKFKALIEADFLEEIFISVRKDKDEFSIENFSEGEKQLANLLMLLDLTKDYKALFLLDEFDSYLHPNWQREFVNLISQIDIRGQILFTTHSAASISKMRKENVFIMKKGKVYSPNSETYNRDLCEIMEENMGISLRPQEYEALVNRFRNAIVHGNKEEANIILNKIKDIIGEDDPFLITARIALNRMD